MNDIFKEQKKNTNNLFSPTSEYVTTDKLNNNKISRDISEHSKFTTPTFTNFTQPYEEADDYKEKSGLSNFLSLGGGGKEENEGKNEGKNFNQFLNKLQSLMNEFKDTKEISGGGCGCSGGNGNKNDESISGLRVLNGGGEKKGSKGGSKGSGKKSKFTLYSSIFKSFKEELEKIKKLSEEELKIIKYNGSLFPIIDKYLLKYSKDITDDEEKISKVVKGMIKDKTSVLQDFKKAKEERSEKPKKKRESKKKSKSSE